MSEPSKSYDQRHNTLKKIHNYGELITALVVLGTAATIALWPGQLAKNTDSPGLEGKVERVIIDGKPYMVIPSDCKPAPIKYIS